MISLESFIRRPLWNVIQALFGQKALSAEFSFDLSGHPSVLNSCSFRHTYMVSEAVQPLYRKTKLNAADNVD